MKINIYTLENNLIESLDGQELTYLSRKFFEELDVDPDQLVEDVRLQIFEATTTLSQIISLVFTKLSDVYIRSISENASILEIGLVYKLEEDLGVIMSILKGNISYKVGDMPGIFTLIRHAAELKTAYLFLIYYPVMIANSYQSNIEEYFKNFFRTFRANASILGYGEKMTKPSKEVSKYLIPSPERVIASHYRSEVPEHNQRREREIDNTQADMSNFLYEEEHDEKDDEEDI